MSHPKYVKQGPTLVRLVEECSEVIAAGCKVMRFGWLSSNPEIEHGELNEVWLRREIADVEATIAEIKRERKWE